MPEAVAVEDVEEALVGRPIESAGGDGVVVDDPVEVGDLFGIVAPTLEFGADALARFLRPRRGGQGIAALRLCDRLGLEEGGPPHVRPAGLEHRIGLEQRLGLRDRLLQVFGEHPRLGLFFGLLDLDQPRDFGLTGGQPLARERRPREGVGGADARQIDVRLAQRAGGIAPQRPRPSCADGIALRKLGGSPFNCEQVNRDARSRLQFGEHWHFSHHQVR